MIIIIIIKIIKLKEYKEEKDKFKNEKTFFQDLSPLLMN